MSGCSLSNSTTFFSVIHKIRFFALSNNPEWRSNRCRRILDVDSPHFFLRFCHVITFFFGVASGKASSGSGNAVVQALAIALYKPAVGSYFLLLATLSRISVLQSQLSELVRKACNIGDLSYLGIKKEPLSGFSRVYYGDAAAKSQLIELSTL